MAPAEQNGGDFIRYGTFVFIDNSDQRTNGPIKARLISDTMSTKTSYMNSKYKGEKTE